MQKLHEQNAFHIRFVSCEGKVQEFPPRQHFVTFVAVGGSILFSRNDGKHICQNSFHLLVSTQVVISEPNLGLKTINIVTETQEIALYILCYLN